MSSVQISDSTMIDATNTVPWRRGHAPVVSSEPNSHEASSGDVAEDVGLRLKLVRTYGEFSLAYTTAVHDSLDYFGDEHGYIAYALKRKKYALALGDPVVAPEAKESTIRRFIAEHRSTAFCQVSRSTAEILSRMGYFINEMGVDSIVPLLDYDFRGKKKAWLRIAESWTKRRGYVAREATTHSVGLEQIEAVSLAWRESRIVKQREVRFLTRPLEINDEPLTRRFFFFDPEEKLLAFVFFDPIYRDSKLIGYAACSKRRHPDAPPHAEQAIMKRAIEVFQSEGLQELRFGLSPLAWIEDKEFRSSRFLSKLFRSGFHSRMVNKHFYNVQGHAEYKRRYRGYEEKLYYATRTPLNLLQLAALIKACKLV